ncbi:MAG TPA: biotin/lipoyl-binding protein [Steroidobacteraceae bacterium]|nr:biotin/lipoyl-binding protein [Steroidobacteraceae bacterium]
MRIRFHREARTSPDVIDGLKVPYAAAKRAAPKWRWRLILLVVLSPALYLLVTTAVGLLTWSANGSVFLEQSEIRAPAAARIAHIYVKVGSLVKPGTLLAELEDANLDAQIKSLESAAPTKRSPKQAALLEQELALQMRSLESLKQRLAATQKLVAAGAATAAEEREAQVAVDQSEAAVLRLRHDMNLGSAPAEKTSDNALTQLMARREQLEVRATSEGRVVDVLSTEGEFVGAGDPMLIVGSEAEPQVLAYVSPQIAPKLVTGSRATIRFPDGSKVQGYVAERPMLTRRMPADLVDQFGVRPMTVVLHLQAAHPLSANQRIHGLPVTIRFHYSWEPQSN